MKMKLSTISIFFFLISASARLLNQTSNNTDVELYQNELPHIKRSDFPPGFLFGSATSAYQVEGAYLEDDKSLSNWDVYCHSIGCGLNGENGDIADDHYHLFMSDIELMHSLGIQAYRFSISWARILPRGRFGKVNPAAIMFYNKILDNLILKGLEPFVTIYHVDFPQEFEDRYGSWLNPEMQEEFLYLAEICFKYFGDRVKHWVTINEPKYVAEMAYEIGVVPPSRCSEPYENCNDGNSDVEPLIAIHNMLLAHGRGVKLYHEYFQPKQRGLIGLTVHACMYEPLTDTELDQGAAKRAFAFHAGWVLDPSIYGEYPEEIQQHLGNRLPSFSLEEKNFMKNSIDFIGINHYSSIYAKDCTNSSCSATANRAMQGFVDTVGKRDGVLIGGLTGVEGSYVVPGGMRKIVNLMKNRYNNMPMFVTENGYSSPNGQELQVNELLNDVKRIEYHSTYLASLLQSMREGADVRGYFAWSLLDSYEWLKGYYVRYGFYYVDHQTQIRIPKLSARWYKNFLTNNGDLIDKETSRDNASFHKDVKMQSKARCIEDFSKGIYIFCS